MLVTHLYQTFGDPMDRSPPASSVRGISQARILEWVAMSFSRGSSQPRDGTRSPTLQVDSLPPEPPGYPKMRIKRCERNLTVLGDWFLLPSYFQRTSVNASQVIVP